MNNTVEPLVFIKFKDGNDIVGFLTSNTSTHYTISRPLHIKIETDLSSGRQMIEVREVLPPILVELDTITYDANDIVIITPIRDSFKEELESVISLFYSVKLRPKSRNKDDVDKIIPFSRDSSSKIH